MWTTENRSRYDRDRLRYPSDLTDAEWAEMRPQILRRMAAIESVLGPMTMRTAGTVQALAGKHLAA